MGNVKIQRNIASLKNIEMFYLDTRTEGQTILCLHGRWGRAETWVDFIQQYGEKYRVIAPDQRGHGLSGKPISKYTAEEMAEDIVELLNLLKIESVILVGHSMGGRVAGYMAAMYPQYIKALAILDKSASGPSKSSPLPLAQIPSIDPLTQEWPMPFSSLTEARDFIQKFTESDLSYQYFMNSLVESVEGYRMMFSSQAIAANIAYDENWFHLLPEIKCLTLLLRANGSGAVSDEDFDKMQAVIPNSIAYEIAHPDHNVHLANKEEFYRYFDEFLARI